MGLEAQEASVKALVASRGGEIIASFQEVESGRKDDRPQLEKAIQVAKETGACLVIAKIDRLARNLHFVTTLQKSKVV